MIFYAGHGINDNNGIFYMLPVAADLERIRATCLNFEELKQTVSSIAGKSVTTIEAMVETNLGRVVRDAWIEAQVPQCGYCQSGQIMSATALLAKNKKPTDADIDTAMAGNICRCGTYVRIRKAIHLAAGKK